MITNVQNEKVYSMVGTESDTGATRLIKASDNRYYLEYQSIPPNRRCIPDEQVADLLLLYV